MDEQYFPGTGYWRGPVWISVNYMVLRGLYKYYNNLELTEPLDDEGTMLKVNDYYKALR
jgi:glycogen debranching enzyme